MEAPLAMIHPHDPLRDHKPARHPAMADGFWVSVAILIVAVGVAVALLLWAIGCSAPPPPAPVAFGERKLVLPPCPVPPPPIVVTRYHGTHGTVGVSWSETR